MYCLICQSDKDVENIGNIYTIGSEGTDLCLNCRIKVSNYIRGLMTLGTEIRKIEFIKYRR